MKPQIKKKCGKTLSRNSAYDVCRYYVEDCVDEGTLGREAADYICGKIRSRNLSFLSSLSTSCENERTSQQLSSLEGTRVRRQISAFFKKNASLINSVSVKQAAIDTFLKCEAKCQRTNERLVKLGWYSVAQSSPDDVWDIEQLDDIARHIKTILGPFEDFEKTIINNLKITSGATATLPKKKSQPFRKVGTRLPCSVGLMSYYDSISKIFGYELQLIPTNVNRVTTVPKNWKTERTIACEPTGNVPVQLAFDEYLKKRLRKFGVDLSDQSNNQRKACLGSIFEKSYSTIDISNASDTLALNLIIRLLPDDWTKFLLKCRSPFYKLPDGSRGCYSKFSSMGNGVTFTLETLVFLACCRVTGSVDHAVYGDDIVIDRGCSVHLIDVLSICGFEVNEDKSYREGPFKESCGTDWYSGVNVTPYYVKGFSDRLNKPQLCQLINGLASICTPNGRLHEFLVKVVKERKLPFVPYGINVSSDTGIWVTTHDAYRKRLFSTHTRKRGSRYPSPWIPSFKGYVQKARTIKCVGSKSRFLWHLQKLRMPESVVQTSCLTIESHKYEKQWLSWVPPKYGMEPGHLTWWSESVTR